MILHVSLAVTDERSCKSKKGKTRRHEEEHRRIHAVQYSKLKYSLLWWQPHNYCNKGSNGNNI